MYTFNNTEETTKLTYISPGIEDVTITGVTYNDEKSFNMGFVNDLNQTLDYRFWITTDKKDAKGKTNLDNTLEQVLHMATKVMTEADFKAKAVGNSMEELVININNLLMGKRIRLKFAGKEVQGQEGKKNWIKAVLPRFRFAESITVPRSETKLVFDKTNQWDMKMLPVTEQAAIPTGTKASDDLPF